MTETSKGRKSKILLEDDMKGETSFFFIFVNLFQPKTPYNLSSIFDFQTVFT